MVKGTPYSAAVIVAYANASVYNQQYLHDNRRITVSYMSAYLPDGFDTAYDAYMSKLEAHDEAVNEHEKALWDLATETEFAEDLANNYEVGIDYGGAVLRLAAYARTPEGAKNSQKIAAQLAAMFEDDMRRVAEADIERKGY